MDYDAIINSTYKWISIKKVIWFLIFFWLAFPVIFLVPSMLQMNFFSVWIVTAVALLYDVMSIALIVSFLVLITACLEKKNLRTKKVSLTRFIDTIFVVIIKLWYVFVWSMHKSYRYTQLLLLVGTALLSYYFYYSFGQKDILLALLLIFAAGYLITVIYNSVKLCFSVIVFYNKDVSVKGAVKESWHLTHRKFWQILLGLIFSAGTLLVLFIVVCLVLGSILNIILLLYFIPPVAYAISSKAVMLFALAPVLVGFCYSVIEIYSQLEKHRASTRTIKHFLARKVLSKGKVVKRKSVSVAKKKKKVVKKKRVAKKKRK